MGDQKTADEKTATDERGERRDFDTLWKKIVKAYFKEFVFRLRPSWTRRFRPPTFYSRPTSRIRRLRTLRRERRAGRWRKRRFSNQRKKRFQNNASFVAVADVQSSVENLFVILGSRGYSENEVETASFLVREHLLPTNSFIPNSSPTWGSNACRAVAFPPTASCFIWGCWPTALEISFLKISVFR